MIFSTIVTNAHPGPWRLNESAGEIQDAEGRYVLSLESHNLTDTDENEVMQAICDAFNEGNR